MIPDYITVERFILEIFTNDICKALFFLNKEVALEKMTEEEKPWFLNLHYPDCKRHSDCLITKLQQEVFNYYCHIPDYLNKNQKTQLSNLFQEFYLCHKLIPYEPFIDYCIRFGNFYERNCEHLEEFSHINELMRYCLLKLLVSQNRFPHFTQSVPDDWLSSFPVIPPYIRFQMFQYHMEDCIHKLKKQLIPEKLKHCYLFSGLGFSIKVEKISEGMLLFLTETIRGSFTTEAILKRIRFQLHEEDYIQLIQSELPALINNQSLLFSHTK